MSTPVQVFNLDGSETSWLVYADWLEDQDIDATHIRQEIVENSYHYEINSWHYESRSGGGGHIGDFSFSLVGTKMGFTVGSHQGVGCIFLRSVGCGYGGIMDQMS